MSQKEAAAYMKKRKILEALDAVADALNTQHNEHGDILEGLGNLARAYANLKSMLTLVEKRTEELAETQSVMAHELTKLVNAFRNLKEAHDLPVGSPYLVLRDLLQEVKGGTGYIRDELKEQHNAIVSLRNAVKEIKNVNDGR